MKAKTYVLDDLIVCVLRNGHTTIEQTMMESGEPERVLEMRRDFQRVMGAKYRGTSEQLTGRTVIAFRSQTHVAPDITLEVFFVDRPLDGFGAAEVIEPARLDGEQPTSLAAGASDAPAPYHRPVGKVEIRLLNGDTFDVEASVEEAEKLLSDAARSGQSRLAWFIETHSGERVGINPAHVASLRPSDVPR